MSIKDLLYIESENNSKLFYHFTPAAIASNFVPLIVILSSKESSQTLNFEYKMWNVLTIVDNFTYENKDDISLHKLLQNLILQVAEDNDCEDHVYLYGSAEQGYGAIVHGILASANAVYADITSKENDLCDLLNPTDSFPIFYLGNNKEEVMSFTHVCKKNKIKFELDFSLLPQDSELHRLKKVLDMFEHMTF